jgi:hypothetical protein
MLPITENETKHGRERKCNDRGRPHVDVDVECDPNQHKPITIPRVPLQEKIDKSVPAAGSHVNCCRLLLISTMVDAPLFVI